MLQALVRQLVERVAAAVVVTAVGQVEDALADCQGELAKSDSLRQRVLALLETARPSNGSRHAATPDTVLLTTRSENGIGNQQLTTVALPPVAAAENKILHEEAQDPGDPVEVLPSKEARRRRS